MNMLNQVDIIGLKHLQLAGVGGITDFLRFHLDAKRNVWCRIPDHLQFYVRKVSLGGNGVELRTEYFPVSSEYKYLSVSDQVIWEILNVGDSVGSSSNLVASLDEKGFFSELDLLGASLLRLRTRLSANQTPVKKFRAISERSLAEEEVFVLASSRKGSTDGACASQLIEQNFPIELSDLFVLRADYQSYSVDPTLVGSGFRVEEWMSDDLQKLNSLAAAYNKDEAYAKDREMGEEQLKKLRLFVADKFGLENAYSNKVTAAIKLISSSKEYFPDDPRSRLSGENKVSLLDIANEIAKSYWRGNIEETRLQYNPDLDKSDEAIENCLKSHGVKYPVALSRELRRFIRF